MSEILNINTSSVAQIIGDSNRFLFHILLVQITTCIINGDNNFFTENLFKTLLISAIAIIIYHIFFKKIIEPVIEKMNLICFNKRERHIEKIKLYKKNPHKLKHKKKIYELRNKKQKSRSISKRT